MTPEDMNDVEDKASLDALNSGFSDTPLSPEPTPTPAKEETPVKVTTEPQKADPPPAEAPATPEYVQITKEQLASLETAAAKVTEFGPKLDKALGTFGNVQQIVKDLQAATPKGLEVALPDDVVAEMEAEFPEIADHLRKSLEKALKGIRGTGGEKAAGLDQEAVSKLVSDASNKVRMEDLEDAHPDWQEIVAKPGEDGQIDQTRPFRKWLAEQPVEYREKINSTNNPALVHRAIDKFLAATKAPPAAAPKTPAPQEGEDRRGRIAAAVQPKGDGGQPPPAKTVNDDFLAGFREG